MGKTHNDPTAERAIGNATRDERMGEMRRRRYVCDLVKMLKQIIHFAGFELVGSITLRDRATGKEYK